MLFLRDEQMKSAERLEDYYDVQIFR